MSKLKVGYDELQDILTIDGKKFSGEYFRNMDHVTPDGKCYRVIEMDDDKVVTVIVQDHVEKIES